MLWVLGWRPFWAGDHCVFEETGAQCGSLSVELRWPGKEFILIRMNSNTLQNKFPAQTVMNKKDLSGARDRENFWVPDGNCGSGNEVRKLHSWLDYRYMYWLKSTPTITLFFVIVVYRGLDSLYHLRVMVLIQALLIVVHSIFLWQAK